MDLTSTSTKIAVAAASAPLLLFFAKVMYERRCLYRYKQHQHLSENSKMTRAESVNMNPLQNDHPNSVFFSEGYDEAREKFRRAASRAGAELHALPLAGPIWGGAAEKGRDSFTGENRLTIDIAVLHGPERKHENTCDETKHDSETARSMNQQKRRLMIHMSGVHGVEGHAGSAIQCKFLDAVGEKKAHIPPGVSVVFVHILNPYGFKFQRRFNENNVDLNRNLIVFEDLSLRQPDEEAPKADGEMPLHRHFVGIDVHSTTTTNDGTIRRINSAIFDRLSFSHRGKKSYDTFSHLFNLPRIWRPLLDDLYFAFRAPLAILCYGFHRLKHAIVSAQYHKPDGIFYGGDRIEASHIALYQWLLQYTTNATTRLSGPPSSDEKPEEGTSSATTATEYEVVLMWDVHTGLGPQGRDTLLVHHGKTTTMDIHGQPNTATGYIIGDMGDKKNAAAGYEDATGSTLFYLWAVRGRIEALKRTGWQRGMHVTQEFGTVSGIEVIFNICREASVWAHGSRNEVDAWVAAEGCRNAFYVNTPSWKDAIIRRGIDAIEKNLEGLHTLPASAFPEISVIDAPEMIQK